MTKHTPGPWTIDTISGWTDGSDRDLNGDIWIRGAGDVLPFGKVFTDTEEREIDPEIIPERIANARLMAAAPELLDALQGLADCAGLTWLNGYKDELDAAMTTAREAIAKSKGGER